MDQTSLLYGGAAFLAGGFLIVSCLPSGTFHDDTLSSLFFELWAIPDVRLGKDEKLWVGINIPWTDCIIAMPVSHVNETTTYFPSHSYTQRLLLGPLRLSLHTIPRRNTCATNRLNLRFHCQL